MVLNFARTPWKDICRIKCIVLLIIMNKKGPFFTASIASLAYFITFIILRYLLDRTKFDLLSALAGAVVFWIVIFLVHQFLNRSR